jgi:O-antigen ligase
MGWFIAVVLVVAGLAVRAEPLTLLAASPVLAPFSEQWQLGGVWVDSSDLVLAALAVVLVLRPAAFRPRARVPVFGTWFALGLLACAAYVAAEQNQKYITDPVRLAYQLYRYCWKPLLFYPLTAMLLRGRADFERVLVASVLGAVLCSASAISQGYEGMRATGPSGYSPNDLGGMLLVPLMACLLWLVEPPSRRARWLCGIATLVIVRALLFSGSRGAMAGALAGGGVLVSGLRATSGGRQRIRQLATVAMLILVGMTFVRGNPLERPTLHRFVVGDSYEEQDGGSNLQWRREQRWPHFLEQVRQHPWLGVGTDVDLSLGDTGNTPHNGYLSIAVTSGVPAFVLFLLLVANAVREGRFASRRAREEWQRPMAVAVSAALVSVLMHNLVDSTLMRPPVLQGFWMFAAMAARLGREARHPVEAAETAMARPQKMIRLAEARPG